MSRKYALISLLLLAIVLHAAAFDSEKDVAVELQAAPASVSLGETFDLQVRLRVPADYHITSLETGLFTVVFDSVPGIFFEPPRFPKGKIWKGEEVFPGDVIVSVRATVSSGARIGVTTLRAQVGYQICAETGNQQCFLPVEREAQATVTIQSATRLADSAVSSPASVAPETTTPQPAAQDSQPQLQDTIAAEFEVTQPDTAASLTLVERLESALKRGSLLAFLLVFIGGVLTSFTPCVYPIIPITVSYIGARAEGKKLRGFLLSIFFVLGLALMYSTLGIIAALTGGVFGGLTQHPAVYIVLIVIFLAMGASMMGAFDLQLPASWQGKLQSGQRRGFLGAALMGMASGLIAAPCVGPVLVALLSWVAQTGSVLMGFSLLLSFSLGLGMLFILIGTFAGAISALPQAGGWMEGIKHFFGWLLWGTAVYFLGNVLPAKIMPLIWGAFLSLLGIFVGAFRPAPAELNWNWMLRRWVGVLALLTGLCFFLYGLARVANVQIAAPSATSIQTRNAPNWIVNDVETAFAQAAAENKPLMMDFYADWCVACRELDHKTYNQAEILQRASRLIALKMDFTEQSDWSKEMTAKYRISGMPTVIFFDAQGREVERFVGFKDAAGVAQIMDRVLNP